MRKFLFSLLSLLTIGGGGAAWATTINLVSSPVKITNLDDLQEGGYYILQNNGGGKWYNYAADNALVDAKSGYGYSCVVRLKKNNGNIIIQQAETNSYYQALTENAQLTLGSEEVEFIFTQNTDGSFFIENNNLYINCNHSNASGYPLGGKKTLNGDFSKWNIFQVTVKESNVITDISEANNSTAYTVTAPRSAWVVAENGTALTTIKQAGLAADKSDSKQQFAFLKSEVTGNYYLYSISASKFLTNQNTLTDTGKASPVFFADASSYRERSVRVYFDALDAEKNINIGGGNQITVDYWNTADDGCSYYIEVAQEDLDLQEVVNNLAQEELNSLKEDVQTFINAPTELEYAQITKEAIKTLQETLTEIQSSSDIIQSYSKLAEAFAAAKNSIMYIPDTNYFYIIKNARGSIVYDSQYDNYVDATNGDANFLWYDESPDPDDITNLWGFIEKEENGETRYYMYNVARKQFAAIGKGDWTAHSAKTWIFSNTPSYITLDDGKANEIPAPHVRICATDVITGETYGMSVNKEQHGPIIAYDDPKQNGTPDEGVPMLFTKVRPVDEAIVKEVEKLIESVEPYIEALLAVINKANEIPFGEGLGEYSEIENAKVLNALEKAVVTSSDKNKPKEDYINAREDLEAAIATLKLNMPKAKTFLRIKGSNGGRYLTAGYSSTYNDRSAFTQDEEKINGKETILYYDGTSLLNYSTGYYLTINKTVNGFIAWASAPIDNPTVVGFQAAKNGTSTKYNISYDGGNRYLYNGNNDYADGAGSVANNTEGYNFELEEVSELPLTLSHIGNKYYSTLNLPVDVTISGANAYAPTLSDNNTIICNEAITKVPAGTPVILISDDNANAVAKIGTVSSTATSELSGTLGKTPNTGNNVYVLSYDDNYVVAFYKYTGANIPGFKAYYTPKAGATESAKFAISFADDDDITAVESVEAAASSAENAVYYDLQGRRVVAPQAGQLYIVNGKKVVY